MPSDYSPDLPLNIGQHCPKLDVECPAMRLVKSLLISGLG